MSRYISRVSAFWLLLAVAMFIVTVAITGMITWTEGGLLERGEADAGDHPVQLISIYEPVGAQETSPRYYVNYGENAAGSEGVITFFIPPSAEPILVVNNLVNERGCSSPRSADSWAEHEAEGGGVNVEVARYNSSTASSGLYIVRPQPSEYRTQVFCRVHPASRSETYTGRVLPLMHYSPADDPVYQDMPSMLELADIDARAALAGAAPLRTILVNFSNIPGARDMRFLGGFEPEDEYAHETKRLLVPGQYSWVMWDDIYRQQMRDILLIVIGTLIGIGVTVMIEGVRPMIEGMDKRDKAAPPPPTHSS